MSDSQPTAYAWTLTGEGRGAVHWTVAPAEDAQSAFRAIFAGNPATLDAETRSALADLAEPAHLLVFSAAGCPHCPHAVRAAVEVAGASPRIEVVIAEAQVDTDLAAQYRVQAAPTTVFDGGLARTGVRTAMEMAADVLGRGTPDFEAAVFGSLVETGRFDQAVQRIHEGTGAPAFLARWRESTTSTRIGLLLTAEQALNAGSEPFHAIVEGLVEVSTADDVALRGDTADLLGRLVDHPVARAALERLSADENPDVAEIAQDALDEAD